ncbi:MAG: transposase [Deltaproteobacteria bacterium]|jgi:hypothetical protein|nr:transposase [Deltaproteobacteria bacterium]
MADSGNGIGTPDGGQGTPDGVQGTPDGVQGTPDGVQGTPDGGQGTPDGVQGTPDGVQGTPDGVQGTPDGVQGTPDGVQGTPDGGQGTAGNIPIATVLPGFISYEVRVCGVYATYSRNTFVKDGKVCHDSVYLGKVIDKDKGIFFSRKRGEFTFSLANGFGEVSSQDALRTQHIPAKMVYDFGDVWLIDQVLQQTGLDRVIETLFPDEIEARDALKTLVAYKLIKDGPSRFVEFWYPKTYASVLYPDANVPSPRISGFLARLGTDEKYARFFESYLGIAIKKDDITRQISFVALIDSVGFRNDIKTFLTAVNNHGGLVSKELRIIFVVDKNSKLPLYFRICIGNIIDNSLLINTVNLLAAHDLDLDLIIMDAGFSARDNISQLCAANIPFLTRMPQNRKEYKQLIKEHGPTLDQPLNSVTYNGRSLYIKPVPITVDGHSLFAYIILDLHQAYLDEHDAIQKYAHAEDKEKKISEAKANAGNFVLLSSNEYPIDEIVELYYTRQNAEQFFDIIKNFAGGLPLRGHSEETIRGIILVTFIASVVYSTLSHKLRESKFSANAALVIMGYLRLTVYDHVKILEELTKEQKDILRHLGLDIPFEVESGTKLHKKNSLLAGLKPVRRGRGRPAGRKSIPKAELPRGIAPGVDRSRRKGRPKGSKNRPKVFPPGGIAIGGPILGSQDPCDHVPQGSTFHYPKPASEVLRKRGRPKGSKNKPKTGQPVGNASVGYGSHIGVGRGRGRPRGSKNRPKAAVP